ncbi:MAG TPA: hypothetical protein VHQ66_08965, partial [Myxococcota bacterium]|nr:hypothetical protein [Myxococcota bacterium]
EAGARLLGEVRPERARRALRWRPLAAALAAALAAFLGVRALYALASAPAAPRPARAPGLVRHDYVRELATKAGARAFEIDDGASAPARQAPPTDRP